MLVTSRGRAPRTVSGASTKAAASSAFAWLLVALATLAAPTLAAAQETGQEPALAATARSPAGLIAFVDPALRLALLDPTDLSVQTIGRPGQSAVFPVWSPSGNRVAAIVGADGGVRVDLVDVARGTAPVTVYQRASRAPIYLYFSPDDRHLSLLVNAPGGTLELELIALDATVGAVGAVTTFASGQPFYWVWLRTARSVLVHRNVLRSTAEVGVSRLESYAVETPLPSPGAFQAPDVSGSQRYAAYVRAGEGGGELVVVTNPAVSEPRVAAQVPVLGLVAFAWRPGSEQVAVQGAATTGGFFGPLELLDVETGALTQLSSREVVASFWSPDGRWIATLSLGAGTEQFVQAAALQPVQARLPRLRLRLIEADTLRAVDFGEVTPTPAFTAQYLPFFDQYSRSHRLWSADSRSIVLPTVTDRGASLLVAYTVDGEAIELVPGDMPAWNVR